APPVGNRLLAKLRRTLRTSDLLGRALNDRARFCCNLPAADKQPGCSEQPGCCEIAHGDLAALLAQCCEDAAVLVGQGGGAAAIVVADERLVGGRVAGVGGDGVLEPQLPLVVA